MRVVPERGETGQNRLAAWGEGVSLGSPAFEVAAGQRIG